jgi:hypothetical protein
MDWLKTPSTYRVSNCCIVANGSSDNVESSTYCCPCAILWAVGGFSRYGALEIRAENKATSNVPSRSSQDCL